MVLVRVLGVIGALAIAWMVGASQVAPHVRIGVSGVVPGATMTQPFGCTSLMLEPVADWCPTRHFHSGIDLAAPTGTDVYSATSGTAQTGFDPSGAGNYVAVQFDSHVRILYCHLSAFRVSRGQQVDPGQLVGTVGATGLATGPHVHFEIQVDGIPVDPAVWLGS